MGAICQAAGRKAQRHREPNDRKYSKKAQSALRRMGPEDFDRLIRPGDDDRCPMKLKTRSAQPTEIGPSRGFALSMEDRCGTFSRR